MSDFVDFVCKVNGAGVACFWLRFDHAALYDRARWGEPRRWSRGDCCWLEAESGGWLELGLCFL